MVEPNESGSLVYGIILLVILGLVGLFIRWEFVMIVIGLVTLAVIWDWFVRPPLDWDDDDAWFPVEINKEKKED